MELSRPKRPPSVIMDTTNKTAVVMQAIRPPIIETCRMVKGSLIALRELSPSPARDATERELLELAAHLRSACRAYNNARARMAGLERATGAAFPMFYQGELREAGELPTPGCDCGLLRNENLPTGKKTG